MQTRKPTLGISMGDPAGIGPEITAAAIARPRVAELCNPIVIGDARVMQQAVGFARVKLQVNAVESVSQAKFQSGVLNVIDLRLIEPSQLQIGKVTALAGNAAFESVKKMIELAQAGQIDGTVTCPIHKESLVQAGHHFPGHTEIFAHFTGTSDFTMMLAMENFRVVHVSTHVSLRKACDAVTRSRVLAVIKLGYDACVKLGIANPKIGVAGLNPHASDGGLFGDEEAKHIRPAIEDARKAGMNADGPFPGDTFFPKALGGAFDLCVAMYHDQGHIPAKIRGFTYDASKNAWTSVRGINVSLGLPIIRTSVDHGTAFDQAGHGTASDESLLDAIEYAAKLATIR